MNNFKKILLVLFCLGTIIPCGIAQSTDFDKKEPPLKTFSTIEINVGASFAKAMSWGTDYASFSAGYNDPSAIFSYKTVVYGANFIRGVELKRYCKAGLGIGYFYYKQDDKRATYTAQGGFSYFDGVIVFPDYITTHGIPLFLYLRSDFSDKKTAPYLDLKIGNNFLITKEAVSARTLDWANMGEYGKFRLKNGLYLASNIGITHKIDTKTALNISLGYQYVSRACDLYNNLGFDEVHVKTGYTTVDHQFLLTLGVSF